MEEYDIGIIIPAILPPTKSTVMKLLKKKVLKCLQVMKEVDIDILRPSNLSLLIV